jgi:hypothetical protein
LYSSCYSVCLFRSYGFCAKEIGSISLERQLIAKILKKHIDNAIAELGVGYDVTLQGSFDKTHIRIEIEVISKDGIP